MKYFKKFGVSASKAEYLKWREVNGPHMDSQHFVNNFLDVTSHGTICDKRLKGEAELANLKKKKDYSKGLAATGARRLPRSVKKKVRYNQILTLNEKILNKTITNRELHQYKVLRLLERGRYKVKDMRGR